MAPRGHLTVAVGMMRLLAGANKARHEAYRHLVARGFRTEVQGVAMHRQNDPGYCRQASTSSTTGADMKRSFTWRVVSRKAIACGNAGCSGGPVVTTLVCFFISRARLRVHRAPGIPCALYYPWARNGSCKTSGASRRGNAESHLECRHSSLKGINRIRRCVETPRWVKFRDSATASEGGKARKSWLFRICMTQNSVQSSKLREDIVKKALNDVDWPALKAHLDAVAFTADVLKELCGHIQRCSDWIAKYPKKSFEKKRDTFFDALAAYAREHLGPAAPDKVTAVRELFKLIERGYRSILGALAKCDIGKQPPEVRASACMSRACYEYLDLLQRGAIALQKTKRFEVTAGIDIRDDDGNPVSPDAVVEGLATSVNSTLIMEAINNGWFVDDIVVLPALPPVGETERYQSGSTQVMALFWRHWQRLERRRRYLDGEIRIFKGDQKPPGALLRRKPSFSISRLRTGCPNGKSMTSWPMSASRTGSSRRFWR
jgi:hypothetical protein